MSWFGNLFFNQDQKEKEHAGHLMADAYRWKTMQLRARGCTHIMGFKKTLEEIRDYKCKKCADISKMETTDNKNEELNIVDKTDNNTRELELIARELAITVRELKTEVKELKADIKKIIFDADQDLLEETLRGFHKIIEHSISNNK